MEIGCETPEPQGTVPSTFIKIHTNPFAFVPILALGAPILVRSIVYLRFTHLTCLLLRSIDFRSENNPDFQQHIRPPHSPTPGFP